MKLYEIFRSPQSKTLDFLLENKDDDFFFTEIAKESHTDPRTLKKYFNNWLKQGLIIQKRRVYCLPKYKINKRSRIVKYLIELKEDKPNLKTKDLREIE